MATITAAAKPSQDTMMAECGIGAVSSTYTSSIGVKEHGGSNPVRQTEFTFSSTPFTTTDGATSGSFGGIAAFYTFPVGRIVILGCVGNLTFTTTSSGSLSLVTGQTFGWGVGTVAVAAAGTLATTSINVTPGTGQSVSTFVAAVAATPPVEVTTALVTSSTAQFDGTATAVTLNLNIGTATDASHGTTAGTGTVSGSLKVTWFSAGDY